MIIIKLWLDDVRPAPEGYIWVRTVYMAKELIEGREEDSNYTGDKSILFELIDIDHDAGDFVGAGGDYIRLLDWLEETGRNYPIRIHSANPVGVANMRRIIQRNGWKEVF